MKKQFSLLTLLLLFTIGIGQMWAADPTWVLLDSIDFTNTTDFPAQTITGAKSAVTTATINGVFFRAKAKKSIKINNSTAGVDFDGQNGDGSSHHFGIPVTGVNGSLKVIVYHDCDNSSAAFKVGISHADNNDPSKSQTWDYSMSNNGTKNKNEQIVTKTDLSGTNYIVWGAEAGSSYKVIKRIAIYTEAAATTYTVTYKPGAGSGPDVVDTDAKTVLDCPSAFSYSGYDFAGWKDGNNNDVEVGANVTEDMTLTAQWTVHVDKYTVKYMDGTTVLGTEQVNVGSNPAGLAENPKKDCYTFAAWDPALSTVSGTKDQVIEVSATWTAVYSSSATLISDDVKNNKPNVNTVFAASKIVSSITFTSGNYEFTSNETKKGYYGYKDKASGDYMKILVQQGKRVQVLFGSLDADPTITVNGVAKTLDAARAKGDNVENTFTWTASAEDALISITMGSGTSTLKSVTIEDIPAVDNDNTLKELKVGGVMVEGFSASKHTYYYEVPYGTAVENFPQITAAANSTKAKQVAIQQAVWTDEPYNCYRAQANVQAEDESWGYYDVRFYFGKKQGVQLIKATTQKVVTGYIGGEAVLTKSGEDKSGNTYKLDKNVVFGFTLAGDENVTFAEGDVFIMNITTAPGSATNMGTMKVYDAPDATTPIYESDEVGSVGINYWTLPAAAAGKKSLYIKRGNNDDWNPTFSYVEIQRYMAPFIESFEIAGIGALAIDETNITAEVANDFDVTALTPTIKYWANGEAQIDKTGAQDFTSPVTYTVSSQYAEDATGAYAPVTYTVTITKVVPSATPSITTQPASANYYEGATIAALEVVAEAEDNGTLTYQWYLGADAIDGATAATYQPTVSEIGSYSYTCVVTNKKDDKPAASVTSNAAVIAIEDDPAAIKLFSNTGVLNTTNFISAAATTIEIGSDEYPCLVSFGSNRTSLGGAKQGDLVMYSATKDVAKIKFDLYNANSSAKKAYVWLVEEGDAAATQLDEIEIDGKTRVKTAYYEFNGTKNRTVYLTSGSKADIKVLQAKVIESGNAIKQFGQAGYSLNLNKGRIASATTAPVQFEGATITVSSEYSVLNSSNLATKAANAFTIASPVIMHVERSGGKYYVYQDPADKGTLYSANADIELNTTGTWYFSSESASSAASFTLIRFDLPKAAKPVVADLANVEYCQGSAIDELTVSATVSDGGTMLYQWYKDGVKIDGAEAETYQPTADGEYYVVVVNTKAGYQNSDAVQSNTVIVTGYAATVLSGTTGAENWPGEDATISVTASGKNLQYAWYTCDDAMGTNPVAVEPAVNEAELDVTVGAADTYYKVVVSGDCGDAQEAVITVVARQAVELQDVTGNMKWDFSKANDGSAATSSMCNDEVLANVHGIKNNSDFKSDNIKATANKFSNNKLQASMIMFHTTVPGAVIVKFANTGSKSDYRYLVVNGVQTEAKSKDATMVTYAEYVPAGDVVLTVTTANEGNMFNFTSVEFKLDNDDEPARTDDWLAPGELGTICIPQGAVAVGADIYELVGKEPQYGKIVFESIEYMKPGKPYLFQSKGTRIDFILTDETPATEPDNSGAMKGTFVALNLTDLENVYYFADHALWSCVDLTSLSVPANRAYVKMDEVDPISSPNAAPGRRRITMNVHGEQVVTGVENLNASEQPMKLMINGQICILRGEKLFDVTGKLVK